MKTATKLGLLTTACAVLLIVATSVQAMRIAPPAPATRAAIEQANDALRKAFAK